MFSTFFAGLLQLPADWGWLGPDSLCLPVSQPKVMRKSVPYSRRGRDILSGEVLYGDILSRDFLCRDILSCNIMCRDNLSGGILSGDILCRNFFAGVFCAGIFWAGVFWAGIYCAGYFVQGYLKRGYLVRGYFVQGYFVHGWAHSSAKLTSYIIYCIWAVWQSPSGNLPKREILQLITILECDFYIYKINLHTTPAVLS